jgi:hypothetical protein
VSKPIRSGTALGLPSVNEIRQRGKMADEPEAKKEGELRFTVSAEQWAYLGWLTRNTVLGRTEPEVARQVLTDRLSEMRQEDYRDGQRS